MDTTTTPQAHDLVELNGHTMRIEYLVSGEYAIQVRAAFDDGVTGLDRSELTLIRPAVRGLSPAVWRCRTDEHGRRL